MEFFTLYGHQRIISRHENGGMTYLDTGRYEPMLASADSFPRPDNCKGSPDTSTPFE